jgi:hypothetical protein
MHITPLSPSLSHALGLLLPWERSIFSSHPLTDGPLICHTTVIKHVVSSVADDEFGAIFVNSKKGTVTRTILSQMGIKTKNSTVLEWGFHSVISILFFYVYM